MFGCYQLPPQELFSPLSSSCKHLYMLKPPNLNQFSLLPTLLSPPSVLFPRDNVISQKSCLQTLPPIAHHLLNSLKTGVPSHHSTNTKSNPTTPWSQNPVESSQAYLTRAASTPHFWPLPPSWNNSWLWQHPHTWHAYPFFLAIIISSSDICIELDFIKHFHKWHIYHLINTMNECIIWCLQSHKLTT